MASGSTRPRSTSIATQQGSASAARLTHAIATTSRGTPGSRDPKIERCRIPTNSPPTRQLQYTKVVCGSADGRRQLRNQSSVSDIAWLLSSSRTRAPSHGVATTTGRRTARHRSLHRLPWQTTTRCSQIVPRVIPTGTRTRRMQDIESDTGYDTRRRVPDGAFARVSQTAVYDTG